MSSRSYTQFLQQQDAKSPNAVINGIPVHSYHLDSNNEVRASDDCIDYFNSLASFEDKYSATIRALHEWLDNQCPTDKRTSVKPNQKRGLNRLGLTTYHDPKADGTCLYGAIVASLYGVHSNPHMKSNVYNLKRQLADWLEQYVYNPSTSKEAVALVLSQFSAAHDISFEPRPSRFQPQQSNITYRNNKPPLRSLNNVEETDGGVTSFCKWLNSPEGYMDAKTWGDETELAFFTHMLNVNIILVDSEQPLPCLFDQKIQVLDGHLGDLFTLKLYPAPVESESVKRSRTIVLGRYQAHYTSLKPKDTKLVLQNALWMKMAFNQITSAITKFAYYQQKLQLAKSDPEWIDEDDPLKTVEERVLELYQLFDQVGPIIIYFLNYWNQVHV
jgi:hypothetical protein